MEKDDKFSSVRRNYKKHLEEKPSASLQYVTSETDKDR